MSHAVPSSPEMGLGYLSLPLPLFLNYAGGKEKKNTTPNCWDINLANPLIS